MASDGSTAGIAECLVRTIDRFHEAVAELSVRDEMIFVNMILDQGLHHTFDLPPVIFAAMLGALRVLEVDPDLALIFRIVDAEICAIALSNSLPHFCSVRFWTHSVRL